MFSLSHIFNSRICTIDTLAYFATHARLPSLTYYAPLKHVQHHHSLIIITFHIDDPHCSFSTFVRAITASSESRFDLLPPDFFFFHIPYPCMLYTTGIGTNAHHRLSVCRFVRSIFGTGMVSTCTTAIVIDQGGGTDHPSSWQRIELAVEYRSGRGCFGERIR